MLQDLMARFHEMGRDQAEVITIEVLLKKIGGHFKYVLLFTDHRLGDCEVLEQHLVKVEDQIIPLMFLLHACIGAVKLSSKQLKELLQIHQTTIDCMERIEQGLQPSNSNAADHFRSIRPAFQETGIIPYRAQAGMIKAAIKQRFGCETSFEYLEPKFPTKVCEFSTFCFETCSYTLTLFETFGIQGIQNIMKIKKEIVHLESRLTKGWVTRRDDPSTDSMMRALRKLEHAMQMPAWRDELGAALQETLDATPCLHHTFYIKLYPTLPNHAFETCFLRILDAIITFSKEQKVLYPEPMVYSMWMYQRNSADT